jgi:putative transposase
LLSEAINRALARHHYHLAAFVYMPEHIHLLVFADQTSSSIPDLLRAIKRPYSFRIKRLLEGADRELMDELTIRQRPNVTTFRFWQEGPGYDRNLNRAETIVSAIHYVHQNPVRRCLVKSSIDWPWSSARWYADLPYDSSTCLPKLEKVPTEFLTL